MDGVFISCHIAYEIVFISVKRFIIAQIFAVPAWYIFPKMAFATKSFQSDGLYSRPSVNNAATL